MTDTFSIKGQIEASPALKSGTIDYDHYWTLDRGGILNIYGNLEYDDIARITGHRNPIKLIQFARQFQVNEQTLRLLNDIVFYNDKSTRFRETFNGYGAFNDLHFLKYLSNLKCFGFGAFYKIDLSPIRDYVELSDFGIGGYNIPLKPIEGYKHLTSFEFGDKIKDTKIISTFCNLENLGISSQNLKRLDFTFTLEKLKRISFSLGGTTAFEDLTQLKKLEELDIWRTRKLEIEHLSPINKIKSLKVLKLRELPRITDLSWLNNLSIETLVLEDLRGLDSFESLNCQSLKTLVIKDSKLEGAKLQSLGKFENIQNIQIPKWYLDNKSKDIASLSNRDNITEIELKYSV